MFVIFQDLAGYGKEMLEEDTREKKKDAASFPETNKKEPEKKNDLCFFDEQDIKDDNKKKRSELKADNAGSLSNLLDLAPSQVSKVFFGLFP